MKITEYIKSRTLYLDGGMGTLLQEKGLLPGELPERWNITKSNEIEEIHKAYFDAGSNVVNTNTFGANILKFSPEELDLIVSSAVECARRARDKSAPRGEKWIALDIGPTGRMLKPYGDLDFEDAVEIFAKTVRLGVKYGVDLIYIETMSDTYEMKAALLAAKENSSLPVFVSCAFGEDGKLLTGADVSSTVALLEGLGADAIGANCSLGPRALYNTALEFLKYSSVPVIIKPNAGLPKVECQKTVYDVLPQEFSSVLSELCRAGVRCLGGCCGTTPEYISTLVRMTEGITPVSIKKKNITVVSSYTHAVTFGSRPILIGERINPTGKPKFKDALIRGDIDHILKEGLSEEEAGAEILDVNVGLPGIDERDFLTRAVCELQAVTALPLEIDTADPTAMESALRRYNGKALINSVNGKRESMDKIFPLAKKYGGVMIALTLDEDGIPDSAEKRVAIAKRILAEAEKYGIDKKNIIFDPLALTVSADKNSAQVTLSAIRMIKNDLSCHTSLGISNVSFGLPARDIINGTFFALAIEAGLSAAIMNPYSGEMIKSYRSTLALLGLDENFEEYIKYSTDAKSCLRNAPVAVTAQDTPSAREGRELERTIIKGLKDDAREITKVLIKEKDPISVINDDIIPALNKVGEGFEKGTVYLPGLLISAEAAKEAFSVIKDGMKGALATECPVVLATVKGDIHDIGKNIVKMLLENYGFSVYDLGRDVPPERILSEVLRTGAPIVGLSALMTTTVPAMEETVRLIKKCAPGVKTIVGGAVLNEDYAKAIGADKYAKDAMETVRYSQSVNKEYKRKK